VKILNEEEVRPHKVRYYLEKRDAEFAEKMAGECQIICVRGVREGGMRLVPGSAGAPRRTLWWLTKAGQQALSRPSAAEGGGRRPAFTGLAGRPDSGHRV
jgi:hypothetical protein